MRFSIGKLRISRRTLWVMCSVAVTMFAVAVLLSNALRAPQSPIEAGGPTVSIHLVSPYASSGEIISQ